LRKEGLKTRVDSLVNIITLKTTMAYTVSKVNDGFTEFLPVSIHRRRSAAKYGVSGSASVTLGYQTVSDFTLRQLFPNIQTATKETLLCMHLLCSFIYRLTLHKRTSKSLYEFS